MHRTGWLLSGGLLAFALVGGCSPTPAPETSPEKPISPPGTKFDPERTGAIRGQVLWQGTMPVAKPLLVHEPGQPTRFEPNPHQPQIDGVSRAVAGALVYLKNVDTAIARPWNHEAVRVGVKKEKIQVFQGDRPQRIGLVRQGEVVEWANEDTGFFSLRARGAAFFSLPFPRPGCVGRRLEKEGHVEVTCGSGYFWLSSHLFVSSHPYVCLTDEQGRFVLEQVPEGNWEIHCWLPNAEVQKVGHDPELRKSMRLSFSPPWIAKELAKVRPGAAAEVIFSLGQSGDDEPARVEQAGAHGGE